MAAALPTQDDQLGQLFDLIDTDKSGVIEDTEMYRLIKLVKPSTTYEQMKVMFNKVDSDKGNSVDRKEFIKHFKEQYAKDTAQQAFDRINRTISYVVRKPALAEVFKFFDTDGNGTLDRGEMYRMIKISKPKVTNDDLTKIFKSMHIDSKKAAKLSQDEFVSFYFKMFKGDNDDEFKERIQHTLEGRRATKLRMCFDAYDKNGDGVLSVNEFAAMLRLNGRKFCSPDKILDMLTKFDVDDDRKISFKEWSLGMAPMLAEMDDARFNRAVKNMLKAAIV